MKKVPDWPKIDRVIVNLAGEWMGMGNVIMTSLLVESIHRSNPKCKIYILITGKRWLPIVKLMRGSPKPVVVKNNFYRLRCLYLNSFLRFRRPWLKTVYLYDYLAPRRRASLLGKLIGAQYRIGYEKNGDGRESIPMNNTADIPFLAPSVLSFDYSCKFESTTGLKICGGPKLGKYELIERGKTILANLQVQNEKKAIAFHPGCTLKNKMKRWPLSSFFKLAEILGTKSNSNILVFLGPEDDDLKNEWPSNNYVKFVQGYPLTDVAAILSCADGIVSNDSGIMHLAFALGVAGVGLFGPTSFHNYMEWYPQAIFIRSKVICCPCYGTERYGECRKLPAPCMSYISVKDVFEKLTEAVFDKSRSRRHFVS